MLLYLGTMYENIWSQLYLSKYSARSCPGFNLIFMFRVHGCAGLTGCWDARVLMQSVGEERKGHLLNLSMQYGTKGKSPSFCSMNFYVIFVNESFMLMPYLQQTVWPVPWHSNNMQHVRQCRHLNHAWRFIYCWVSWVMSCADGHVVWLQSKNLQNETSWNWY